MPGSTHFPVRYGLCSLLMAFPLLVLSAVAGPQRVFCGPHYNNQSCTIGDCCGPYGLCGTEPEYCGMNMGCQPTFGKCDYGYTAPDADATNATNATNISMRQVGYYQVGQTYGRSCDRVTPEHINTTDLTHLILAFAHIDDSSFEVVPASDEDIPYYTRFTKLQADGLETWISIGGGSFSKDVWRAMISDSSNRKAFITSAVAFMKKYKFQGVDLDYEFPNADGSEADDLLGLAQEMRSNFGSQFGISFALPNDKETMQAYHVVTMSSYVTFYNYMAYDMGGWGVNEGIKQNDLRYQSDIRVIWPDLSDLQGRLPDPSKINLGVPYYGRGYTLPSTDCIHLGCQASGPSSPGPCMKDDEGILSLSEIKQVLAASDPTVYLNADAMQKRLVWGNDDGTQWMGYDDDETVALKLNWADSKGLGGVVYWSVDLNSAD